MQHTTCEYSNEWKREEASAKEEEGSEAAEKQEDSFLNQWKSEKNLKLTFKISRRGEGIARIEGLVIFVPNAKQGEHVRIKVTRISRRFAEAEVVGEGKTQSEEEKTDG